MTGVLMRRGTFGLIHKDTQGRSPCEDEDRDWTYAVTNQGMSSIASNPQKLERQGRILF